MNIFQRAWNGINSSIQAVADYIPRGIIFSAGLIAVSAALGHIAPGLDLMGINSIYAQKGMEGVAIRGLASVAFGGLVNGALGGLQGAFANAPAVETPPVQMAGTQPARARGQQREREVDVAGTLSPQRDLPMNKPIGSNKASASPSMLG